MSYSSSNDSSTHSRVETRPIHRDIESHEAPRTEHNVGLRRYVRLPLRKGHMVSDFKTIVACSAIALCLVQFLYIQRLKAGLVRVPNDPFDNTFGQHIRHTSPEIWHEDRLSFIHNAMPVPVHSHNDYLQRIPLFEALGSGCISVEADIHLKGSELFVAHTKSNIRKDQTLRSMYLEPLQRLLELRNPDRTSDAWTGIYNRALQQPLVLLVDQKTFGTATFAALNAQLQSLRDLDLLTYWDGNKRIVRPLAIVVSGNAPFESVLAMNDTRRDIFYDAKLERLAVSRDDWTSTPVRYAYNQSNSYYASTEFKNARLHSYHSKWEAPVINNTQYKDISGTHMEQAAARGLITRYWNLPSEPPNLREIVWRVLVERRVGVLNMDDLGTVRARAAGWGSIEL